jgi:hypothetical protein
VREPGEQRVSAVVPFVNVDEPGRHGDRGDEESEEKPEEEEDVVEVRHDEFVELS